jgi:uncharacterized membrane protein
MRLYVFLCLLLANYAALANDCQDYVTRSDAELENPSLLFEENNSRELYQLALEKLPRDTWLSHYEDARQYYRTLFEKRGKKSRAIRAKLIVIEISRDIDVREHCVKNPDLGLGQAIFNATRDSYKTLLSINGIEEAKQAANDPAINPAERAKVCNERSDTAFIATAQYSLRILGFSSQGWRRIEPGDCISYGPQTYTYISWDDRQGRSTPPRHHGSMPGAEFCVTEKMTFTHLRAEDETSCTETGSRMETFLKYGTSSETLR